MNHFAIEDWADFARGLASADRKGAMQMHLDNGCGKCAGVVSLWQEILDLAAGESSYQPPESAVRTIKVSYVLEGLRKTFPRGAQIAKLVFDSFRQPLPEGVRNLGPRARQLLYRAGKFAIDLRLDSGPDRASLVGQVLDSTRPDQGVADVPVTLFKSRTRVLKTVTNRLGEFHFEFEDPNGLRVWIGVDQERPVFINLLELEAWRVDQSHLKNSGVTHGKM
ncbi:MAG: hypothetical protein DMG23_10975 [Acidobacteria bacterium]|nr:MAG: hypothetical protein DMG23_10975 [Acidobacteriota bacterium]